MAYRGILPEAPSFSTQLARGLGSGIGQGFGSTVDRLVRSLESNKVDTSKRLSNVSGFISKELKNRGRKSLVENPEYLDKFRKEMIPLIEQGFSEDQAFEAVYGNNEEERKTADNPERSPYHGGGGFDNFKKNLRSLGPAALGAVENLATPFLQLARHKPSQNTLEELLGNKVPYKSGGTHFDLPSEKLAEKLYEGLPEEEIRKLKESQAVQETALGFAIPSAAEHGIKKFGKKAATIPKQIEYKSSTAPGIAAEESIAAENAAAETAKPTLEGRISSEIAESPTEMRITRSQPETRLYPLANDPNLRREQIKLFPRYESEIAADAAQRAARESARIPKTEAGLISKQTRISEAEKILPAVQKSYENSIARVRALEDAVVAVQGEKRRVAQALLQRAQKDLENAEFELIQTLNNAKTGERRVGLPQMEKAAQQKIAEIGDKVAEGEAVTLAKMDYSPEMISEAKKISKSKILPTTKANDYYTMVHDTYANQYKNRIKDIQKEIASNLKEKNMSGLQQNMILNKEREYLEKMIQSADAENKIHRQKMALREISQRKMAQDRFEKLKPTPGESKATAIAEQRSWKGKMEEAKTPQERAKVIDDVTSQMASEDPKNAKILQSEGNSLKTKLEEVINKNKTNTLDPSGKSTGSHFERLMREFTEMKKSFPHIWKSRLGKDFIIGAGTAVFDELFKKDLDLPFGASALVSTFIGRQTYGGRSIRGLTNMVVKGAIKKYKILRASQAYKKGDDESLKNYSPAIKKAAREKAFG